jgi:thiol:disulfide interchange protein DsbD
MNKIRPIIWLLAVLGLPPAQSEDVGDELLEPNKAFQLEAQAKDDTTLIAKWKIANGYYMYREKFVFQTDTPGYSIGLPELPSGKIKHDEFFGDVEIFRDTVTIQLPINRTKDASDTLDLTQKTNVNVPVKPASSTTKLSPLTALTNLADDLGGSNDEFLQADEAFQFHVEPTDANNLLARWEIADGYYLYREKIKFELKDAAEVTLGPVKLVEGKVKHDEFFGRVEIYNEDVEVDIPLLRRARTATEIELMARYQGCAEAGICYPPITKTVNLSLPPEGMVGAAPSKPKDLPKSASAEQVGSAAATQAATQDFQSEQDRIAQTLASGATWLTVLSFYGFGLLLAFTPCVFPMIPILSGIIIGRGTTITTKKAFTLSLVYVLAMAVTYTIAGVLVGLSGENVQAWFQNPWILSLFSGIFVLLSLSMFGFYELQMPSAVQSRLTEISNTQEGGTLVSAGIMGFLSALIVGPCVTAPLIGALIYIANTGDAVLGGLALFTLSLGMGSPLLLLGTSAGKLLPKAGQWMDTTKAVFGVLLLGVGIWLLERILPTQIVMVMSGVLLIVSAIYMGALESIRQGVSGWFRLWKGVGLVMLIYGTTLIIGAVAGGNSILQPLKGVLVAGGVAANSQHGLEFERIKDVQDLNRVLAQAQQLGKPTMLDFYADWCVSCKEMEAFTFTDPRVQAALKNSVLVQADVTANDKQDQELLKYFGLFGPPAILFYTPDGSEQRTHRVVGYMSADQFHQHVSSAFGQGKTLLK